MPLTDQPSFVEYAGNGSNSTPYPIPFPFFEDSDIEVYIDGILLAPGYTISPDQSELVTEAAYTAEQTVKISRAVPFDQPSEFAEGDSLPAQTLNDTFDRAVMQIQQLSDQVSTGLEDVENIDNAVIAAQNAATAAGNSATAASNSAIEAGNDADRAEAAADGIEGTAALLEADIVPPPEPIVTAGLGIPYTDPDAAAVIAATTITDPQGIAHYQRLITGMKKLGIWSKLESGFLFGSIHQSSSTTLQPIKGSNTATGTGTNDTSWVTFNGTTDGYSVANANQTTAATGRALVSIAKHDGATQPATLISNYSGGSSKGPLLSLAGTTNYGTGSNQLDDLVGFWSADGTALTFEQGVQNVNDADWCYCATSLFEGRATVMGNSRDVVSATFAGTAWVNGTTWAIGTNVPGAQDFVDDMAAAFIFSEGLSNDELFEFRLLCEAVLGDTVPFPPSIIWEGNSLTAGTNGGGTSVRFKVMNTSTPAWDKLRFEEFAAPGQKQIVDSEPRYWNEERRWVGASRATRLYWLWTGINDITVGADVDTIDPNILIASIKRNLIAAKEDGFYTIILPLTPVGGTGTGFAYQYGPIKQATLAAVNTWIEGEGKQIADQFLDIRKIGDTYPEFLDPTNFTYYSANDGLHHNDAGRQLIADYVVANVTLPTTNI